MKKYYYECPRVPPLNFEEGPGVPLLNLKEVPGPTFKLQDQKFADNFEYQLRQIPKTDILTNFSHFLL